MEILTTLIICFLAVYGTFQLLYNISLKVGKGKIQSEKLHSVLLVDDTIDAEGYIRNFLLTKAEEELIVLNLCTSNESLKILQILEAEYPLIKIINKDEYIEYINNLE